MARSFTERMIGAATLDIATFEEVEHDESATGQAAAVVALVVRQSLDISTGQAVVASLLGGLAYLVLVAIIPGL